MKLSQVCDVGITPREGGICPAGREDDQLWITVTWKSGFVPNLSKQ